jgi:hypothetical protein
MKLKVIKNDVFNEYKKTTSCVKVNRVLLEIGTTWVEELYDVVVSIRFSNTKRKTKNPTEIATLISQK